MVRLAPPPEPPQPIKPAADRRRPSSPPQTATAPSGPQLPEGPPPVRRRAMSQVRCGGPGSVVEHPPRAFATV